MSVPHRAFHVGRFVACVDHICSDGAWLAGNLE